MKANHTPGPWAVHPADSMELAERHNVPLGAKESLTGEFAVYTDDGRGNGVLLPREQFDANARLIAAAPELLAALENLLIAFPDPTIQDGHRLRLEQVARINGTVELAHLAIAKAKGGA